MQQKLCFQDIVFPLSDQTVLNWQTVQHCHISQLYCYLFFIISGYCWAERHAAGRQETPGAESQCGIQERHSGECPNAGQMTAGWWEAGCSFRPAKMDRDTLLIKSTVEICLPHPSGTLSASAHVKHFLSSKLTVVRENILHPHHCWLLWKSACCSGLCGSMAWAPCRGLQ